MKLTPIIEIAYCNQGIEPPGLYPKIKHSHEWDLYRAATHQKAGFEMPMKPFREGFFLFGFDAVSEFNLEKLVRDHLKAAEEYGEEPIPLPGGFVLEEGEKILLIPQCCGDLSDIKFWKRVSGGCDDLNWEAHPLPDVSYKDGRAFFTCVDDWEEFEEPFVERFDVSLADLAGAVKAAEAELKNFEIRLESLLERLDLPRYANLLTFNRNVQQGAAPNA